MKKVSIKIRSTARPTASGAIRVKTTTQVGNKIKTVTKTYR